MTHESLYRRREDNMLDKSKLPKTSGLRRASFLGFTLIEMLIALLVGTSLVAMTIPVLLKLERNFRSAGDARTLNGEISLAKLRAASDFTKSRVYANTSAGTVTVQVWCKAVAGNCTTANTWSTEGGTATLATGDSFGYGTISSPPSNTQTAIGQASACQTDAQTTANTAGNVSNTACIIFNSRGVPINNAGSPNGEGALYVTDGSSVYGATISASGLVKQWRTDAGTTNWKQR